MPDIEIIDARGNERVIRGITRMTARTKFGIQKGLFAGGQDLKREFNRQVKSKAKTGRVYKYKNRRHQSSAPEETAANRSGHYRRSIGFNVSGNQLTFGNSAKHAGHLENGTSRMKPRPGLKNTLRAREGNLLNYLSDGIESSL